MGAARWVVIGTSLAAAATAAYLLFGPSSQTSSGDAPGAASTWRDGASQAPSEPPLDQIDAESRDKMRDFLRQSVRGEPPSNGSEGKSDW